MVEPNLKSITNIIQYYQTYHTHIQYSKDSNSEVNITLKFILETLQQSTNNKAKNTLYCITSQAKIDPVTHTNQKWNKNA
jgi:hypothetical protein